MESVQAQTEKLKSHVVEVREENVYLRKRKLELESKVNKLEEVVSKLQSSLSESAYECIMSKASSLPASLFEAYAHKVKVTENKDKEKRYHPGCAYTDDLRIFALTLYSYSSIDQ